MRMRAPAVALLVIATTTLAGGQADAGTPVAKAGSGSVGSVNLMVDNRPTTQDSIAPCAAPGSATAPAVGSNSTSGTTPVTGVEFGSAKTTCAVDAKTGEASATAAGGLFRMTMLRAHGGPQIKLTKWSAHCTTKGTGSSASISLSGLSGIAVPSSIPANYQVTVPGAHSGDPALARVVFNELITPIVADGSMRLNLMRITLFPDTPDSPQSGQIVLGTVSCDPS